MVQRRGASCPGSEGNMGSRTRESDAAQFAEIASRWGHCYSYMMSSSFSFSQQSISYELYLRSSKVTVKVNQVGSPFPCHSPLSTVHSPLSTFRSPLLHSPPFILVMTPNSAHLVDGIINHPTHPQ